MGTHSTQKPRPRRFSIFLKGKPPHAPVNKNGRVRIGGGVAVPRLLRLGSRALDREKGLQFFDEFRADDFLPRDLLQRNDRRHG